MRREQILGILLGLCLVAGLLYPAQAAGADFELAPPVVEETPEELLPALMGIPAEAGISVKTGPGPHLQADRTASAGSNNIHSQHYTRWSSPVNSYLFAGDRSELYRVDHYRRGGEDDLVMEVYDGYGEFLRGWNIEMELPVFGGFYAGSDGYYFVFGQNNYDESDSVEVLRVVKYSKELERLGAYSLMGGNTRRPFYAASLRMDEGEGSLFIRTGHEMYKSSKDGLNHQANLILVLDTETLTARHMVTHVSNINTGYVSHSFNQFVKADGPYMVAVDHGDAYPRSIVLTGWSQNRSRVWGAELLLMGGSIGENATGVSVGGLEVSSNNYLTAYNTIDQDNFTSSNANYGVRNLYLAVTDNYTQETKTVQVSRYPEGGELDASTPQLVKLSGDRFAVMWEERRRTSGFYPDTPTSGDICFAFFDGMGNWLNSGRVWRIPGALSDCQPILWNDFVTWYVTEAGGGPEFYHVAIPSEGEVSAFLSSNGVVSLLDLDNVLEDCEDVYAASYDASGRQTGIVQGKLEGDQVRFDKAVSAGWKLYFLNKSGSPVCPATRIS